MKLVDVLGSVHFAATIIYKADTDLLVADTAIQFLKHKLSGKGGIADELLESLNECYLKRRNENLTSRLSFLSRKPNEGFQVRLLKFLKDLYDHLQQPGEFAPDAGLPYPSTLDITWEFASFMAESSSIPNRSSMETWTKEADVFKDGGGATTRLADH